MNFSLALRRRLLASLAVGAGVTSAVLACGGGTDGSGLSTSVCTQNPGSGKIDCYTRAELETLFNYPPGRSPTDAGPPDSAAFNALVDPNGCLPPKNVRDGCCNPASAGPSFDNGKCCYVHCTGACCGRPFTVDGTARVARVAENADWLDPSRDLRACDLHPRDAMRLGEAWLGDALMEHASVASFARFTLDLLAHGAPPELLLEAQRATVDEIEHARLCFGIASRLVGRDLGPGPLEISGASAAASLEEAVAATVREGCVGETIAAVLADARRERATDPDAARALATIAEDEARHAELAWRFVAWAIDHGGEPIRRAAGTALREAMASPPSAFPQSLAGVPIAHVHAFGFLDEAETRAAVRRAIEGVVRPCAEGLRSATAGVFAAGTA